MSHETQPARTGLFDTHCHLHFKAFDDDRAAVVTNALEAGVTHLLTIGCDLADSVAAIACAEQFPGVVFAAVGVHPNAAADWSPAHEARLAELAAHPAVVAIGETGLDFYRDRCPRAQQEAAFAAHQRLAARLGLPLVVHCREAHEATYDSLREHGGGDGRVVMHCYSAGLDMVDRFLGLGCYVGVDGPVTYPRAEETRQIAAHVPLERLLLETDSPFLAPQGRRGRRCEPADTATIAAAVAAVRGLSVDELAAGTTANARAFLGLVEA